MQEGWFVALKINHIESPITICIHKIVLSLILSRRSKHNHNEPYRHWLHDATGCPEELWLYTSRYQGQLLQFRAKNQRSHVIIQIIIWLCVFWRKMASIFYSSGLNLVTFVRCQVISCATKASACHHTLNVDHWHRLWEIPANTGVKSNIATFNRISRFILNMLYWSVEHHISILTEKYVIHEVKRKMSCYNCD